MSAPPPPGDGDDDPTIDELLSMVNDLALGIHGDLSDMLNEATNVMEAYEGVEMWCLLHDLEGEAIPNLEGACEGINHLINFYRSDRTGFKNNLEGIRKNIADIKKRLKTLEAADKSLKHHRKNKEDDGAGGGPGGGLGSASSGVHA